MNEFQFIGMGLKTCRSAPRSRAIVFSVTWAKHATEDCIAPPCETNRAFTQEKHDIYSLQEIGQSRE